MRMNMITAAINITMHAPGTPSSVLIAKNIPPHITPPPDLSLYPSMYRTLTDSKVDEYIT